MLSLSQLIESFDISYHFYVDGTQMYMPIQSSNSSDANIENCLLSVKGWLANNYLKFNDSKTEVILIGPPTFNPQDLELGVLQTNIASSARNLGVLFDSGLSFRGQVNSVVQTCFYQLKLIDKIKHFLTQSDLAKVMHAFIYSRLDYCNALYSGINSTSIHRLQLVQNAAARLLTSTRRHEHITPVLASLHWLPITFRIDFKIL